MRRLCWLIVGAVLMLMGFGMALTADKDVQRKEGLIESHPVEDDVCIYKGALVCANAAGYAVPAADTLGYKFLGLAYEKCDNTLTGHTQGGKSVRVQRTGVLLMVCTDITQAMVGQFMYIKDDQTVDDTSSTYVCAGRLVDYDGPTAGWVDIGQRGMPSDSPGRLFRILIAGSDELGAVDYGELHVAGVPTGHIYARGSWINIDDGAVPPAGLLLVPWESGVYEGAATMTNARVVFGGQSQAILTNAPASLHWHRINTTKAITALLAAANPGSVGYVANAQANSTKLGDIPIADIVGAGVVYVRVYGEQS